MASIIYIYVHRFVKNDVVNHASVERNLTFYQMGLKDNLFKMTGKTHYALKCHQMSMLHELFYIQEVSMLNNETLGQGNNASIFRLKCYMNSSIFKKYLC